MELRDYVVRGRRVCAVDQSALLGDVEELSETLMGCRVRIDDRRARAQPVCARVTFGQSAAGHLWPYSADAPAFRDLGPVQRRALEARCTSGIHLRHRMIAVKSGGKGLMTIDSLALASGMTVRTLRSHASRGLLPPPIMQGRVGYYNSSHLARLTFIKELQSAGFSLSSIQQILSGVPDDAGEAMLHVIRGLLAPWDAEPVTTFTPEQIFDMFGVAATAEALAAFGDLFGAEFDAEGNVTVSAPGLLTAAAEAMKVGLPPEGVAAVTRILVRSAREVASSFVQMFRDTVWKQFIEAGLPEEDWDRITGIHARVGPLAVQGFLSAFQGAMTQEVSSALSAELGSGARDVLQRLLGTDPGPTD